VIKGRSSEERWRETGKGAARRQNPKLRTKPEVEKKILHLRRTYLSFAKTSSTFNFNNLGKPDTTC
jgi:hypothetical protein